MEPIGPEAFEVMREFYNYDREIPLLARMVEFQDEADFVREKIVFRGIRDSRVPGYLAIPKNSAAPYPCVLLLHGIGGSKEDWWEDNSISGKQLTKQLLTLGFAVLSLDAEYHGERIINNDYESSAVFTFENGWLFRARDMVVQSVIEYRRAIDYLATRTEIDSSKIGLIGYSMGGMMAFNLTAVDPRIKTSVACVMPVLKEAHSAMAVHNFAPYIADRSFLMLVGQNDEINYTVDQAQQLLDLIVSNVKQIVIYQGGHKLPAEWTQKAIEWMERYLR
jgi:predicted esterase